ncbi:MAG: anti-sigma factor family protein [Thermoguttaceae bacterium]
MAENQLCLNEPEFQALIDGSLPAERQSSIAAHLETCGDCRRRMEAVSNQGGLESPDLTWSSPLPKGSEALAEAMRQLKAAGADPDATSAAHRQISQGAHS